MSFEETLEGLEELQGQAEEKADPPKTMRELFDVLYRAGENWRNEHTKINEKTGEVKVPSVSPRAVTNILKKYVRFAIVTDDDPEVAPLCAYDLDEGIYKRGERFIGKMILKIEATTNKTGRSNIIGWLEIESEEKEPTQDEHLIVMNNGIFDRNKMKLTPFDPDYVFLTKVAVNYNPKAVEPNFGDWKFTDWLKELSDNDNQKLKLFWQIFYACINANYVSQQVLFFYSKEGKSGKGTFQMLLRNLVGKRNTAALTLRQLSEKWGVYSAYGKALIIGDDNTGKDFIENSSNLRSIATGDIVQAEKKGMQGFPVVLSGQIIQSFNDFPKIGSFDDGFKRRIIMVLFNHTYKGKDNTKVKARYIYDKRLLEWIAYKTVHLTDVILENPKDGLELLDEFEEENNNVLRFYNHFFGDFTSERIPIKFLFRLYQAWNREENNPTNMKQNTFTKDLRSVAEPKGWEYSLKNHATLQYFHEEDQRIMDAFPTTDYFINNSKKKQPLIKRD